MPTVQLLASAYSTSSSGVSVSNASNMYTNTDSNTYAAASMGTSTSLRVYGFNFSQIPSDATITAIEFKVKALSSSAGRVNVYVANKATSSSYSGTQLISSTTATTYTLTPTVDIDTLKAAGSDLCFHFSRLSTSTITLNVYGMEVNVTYTRSPKPNRVDYIKDGVTKTIIDLTGDTATEADVALGKLFHLADGNQAVGTGGGLEFETGTFSPSSGTDMPTVSFTKSHTKPPSIVAVFALSTSSAYTGVRKWIAVDFSTLISDYTTPSSGTYYAGFYSYVNGSSSGGELTTVINKIRYGGANTTSSSTDYWRYFATSSNFKPKAGSSGWQTTANNSWIAIWT